MKPDFIGLGAQKSGTSWLYANLAAHPQVYIPRKEIHFFSRERHYKKGIDWYRDFFSLCGQGQMCGEFSTSYLYSKNAAEQIFKYCSNAKLLVILRNPVDRAFSNYKNDLMAGVVRRGTGFADALKDHPEYIEQGFYLGQLTRFLRYYSRESILISIYEDIKKDPAAVMGAIYRFLNVDEAFESPHLHVRINPSYVPKNQALEKFINMVSSIIKRTGKGGAARFLKKTGIHQSIRGRNRDTVDSIPLLGMEVREELLSSFAGSIERLEAFIDRELPEWKK